jgi:hypothetical protein
MDTNDLDNLLVPLRGSADIGTIFQEDPGTYV